MNFIPHTQEELKKMDIQENMEYLIEYVNKDYFNGEETIEKAKSKAIIANNEIIFIVPDPMGMERFIKDVKIIKNNL